MIILGATTEKLQAFLPGAATTTNPDYFVTYVDVTTTTFTPAESHGALNGSSQVDICAAPALSTTRHVKFISIYNRDTVSQTITVVLDAGGTDRYLWRGILSSNEMVQYTDGEGWKILNDCGCIKVANVSAIQGFVIGTQTVTGNVSFGTNSGLNLMGNGRTLTMSENYNGAFEQVGGRASAYSMNPTHSSSYNFSLQPFVIEHPMTFKSIELIGQISMGGSRAGSYSFGLAIYSNNAGTLSRMTSTKSEFNHSSGANASAFSNSNYGAYSGNRHWPFTMNGTVTLNPGMYYLGMTQSATGASAGTLPIVSWFMHQKAAALITTLGVVAQTNSTFAQWLPGLYGTGTNAFPNAISRSDIHVAGSSVGYQPSFKLL